MHNPTQAKAVTLPVPVTKPVDFALLMLLCERAVGVVNGQPYRVQS